MLLRLAISLAVLRTSPNAERDLEILALRHQVTVLRRQVKRPDLMPADRMILAALGSRLPPGRLLFSPATLLRWHRELVRRHWSAFGLRPPATRSSTRASSPDCPYRHVARGRAPEGAPDSRRLSTAIPHRPYPKGRELTAISGMAAGHKFFMVVLRRSHPPC